MLIFRDAEGNEIAREIGYMPKAEVLKTFSGKGINIEGGN